MTAALVTARDGLEARLGLPDCGPLRRALDALAHDWAVAAAPGAARVLAAGAPLGPAAHEAFARHGGPLLVAASEAPRLGPEHVEQALADLAGGADASFGPGMDGGWYLVALARPHAALLGLLEEAIDGPDVMGRTLAVATEEHLEVGLLRMERLLRTPRDAAALAADPLTPDSVRHALRGMG